MKYHITPFQVEYTINSLKRKPKFSRPKAPSVLEENTHLRNNKTKKEKYAGGWEEKSRGNVIRIPQGKITKI